MYASASTSRDDYYSKLALLGSLVGHLGLVFVLIFKPLQSPQKPAIIYSVTVEGGALRGGVTQIPDKDDKSALVPQKKVSQEEEQEPEVKKQEKPEVKKEEPKKVEEKPEVIIPDEKKQPVTPKKPEPEVKKKVEEKPKAAEPKPKPKEVPKLPVKKDPLPDTNQNYQKAMQRYLGASTDAGGTGFGSAGGSVGKGMGGGVLRSPEWFRYKARLEAHVKQAWNWHDPRANLITRVRFQISQTGQVSGVKIVSSSGNSAYDDAAIRCVTRSTPVPIAPPDIYVDFKDIEIEFTP